MMHADTPPYQERKKPTFLEPTSAERVTVPSSLAGASPMPPVKLWKHDHLTAKERGGRQGFVSDCQKKKKKKQEVERNSNTTIMNTVEVDVNSCGENGTCPAP